MPSKENIQQNLDDLRNKFVSNLPTRLTEMAALTSSLRKNWNTEVADELYREAHSLAGSGGTFGLLEISDTARVLQHTVQTLSQQSRAPDALELSALDQLLIELGTAIAAPALLTNRTHSPDTILTVAGALTSRELINEPVQLSSRPLKILVADDDPFGQEHLKLLLEKDGHEIFVADNGEQAIAMFREHDPELVILDVVMPVMNGLEAAKAIKQENQEKFVPILFLTSLESDDDLVKCIEAGGDDFLTKPLNYVVLRARIHALERIRGLHSALAIYHQRTEEEINLSKHVFDSITRRNSGHHEAINTWEASSGHFSGDLVCYQESQDGIQYLMMGDFTGHGLIAALGAIPVTDVFYTMSKNGFALGDIVRETNRKLKLLLPTGRFLAAGFFRIDSNANQIEFWYGGLPPAMLVGNDDKVSLLKADKLALGILGDEQFDNSTASLVLADVKQLLLYSDGLTEHVNSEGQMLGEEAVIEAIEKWPESNLLDIVVNRLQSHADVSLAEDDITLVSVDLDMIRES